VCNTLCACEHRCRPWIDERIKFAHTHTVCGTPALMHKWQHNASGVFLGTCACHDTDTFAIGPKHVPFFVSP